MKKRILTALVILPFVSISVFFHLPLLLFLFFLLVSCSLNIEILNMFKTKIKIYNKVFLITATVITYVLIFLNFFQKELFHSSILPDKLNLYIISHMIFLSLILINGLYFAVNKNFELFFKNVTQSIFSFIYGTLFFSFGLYIRYVSFNPEHSLAFTSLQKIPATNGILAFTVATAVPWLFDAGGYFFGKAFGKDKLHIAASPKKSWQGIGGGFFLAFCGFFLVRFMASKIIPDTYMMFTPFSNLLYGSFLIILFSFLAVTGDLIASVMKRSANVKDSASTLPGMGGLLDAVDSLIPTYMLYYFVMQLPS